MSSKQPRTVTLKNPLSPSSLQLIETLVNAGVKVDADGNLILTPVFIVNPSNNPISAGTSIANAQSNVGIVDGNGAGTVAGVFQVPLTVGSAFGDSMGSGYGLVVDNIPFFFNVGALNYDVAEEATNTVTASQVGAGSTQVLATGGAAKKYKLFGLLVVASATAAVAAMTVNEVTSAAILASVSFGAAGTQSFLIPYSPNGILQPNANNAIQVTGIANGTIQATLVYGAAR